MKAAEKIKLLCQLFEQANLTYGQYTEDAKQEAIWLVHHVLNPDAKTPNFNNPDYFNVILTTQQIAELDDLSEARISEGVPLPYLVNKCWFAQKAFYIDNRAIIPRSYLVEWIEDGFAPWVKPDQIGSILDMCSGSGCLAITCAMAFPKARVVLSDKSACALKVAALNISKFGLSHAVQINQGNLFQGVEGRFDLIVCNPPYVSSQRVSAFPREFRHEPLQAFEAGKTGLDFILPFLQQVHQYLSPKGMLFLEVGSASEVLSLCFPGIPFSWMSTEHDEMVILALSAQELEMYNDAINNPQVSQA